MRFTGNITRDRSTLAVLLQRLGLPLSLASPLLGHAAAVRDGTDRLGLVAPGDRRSIVQRHTADSLLFAFARPPAPGERWADVGSGAGFPGLVLAICYPATSFTLVEPNSRRAGFLELQVTALGLVNASVEARRSQELGSGFDVAVARALENPAAAILTLQSLVRPGGAAIVAAGSSEARPDGASLIRLEDLGDVDSPGVLFMMSRGA
ncbi:MAG: 16S rRNA (guanine(527)-N(7))-methyltransferase RsmG [Actinomycetota bacterium]